MKKSDRLTLHFLLLFFILISSSNAFSLVESSVSFTQTGDKFKISVKIQSSEKSNLLFKLTPLAVIKNSSGLKLSKEVDGSYDLTFHSLTMPMSPTQI